MQLKLKRSQSSTMMGKVLFALDARADLTQEERHLVDKYKLGKMVIYNSAVSAKHLETVKAAAAGHAGMLRGAISLAISKLSLNVTIDSLTKGHHIECKDLDEMLGAEEAIMEGCKALRAYLDAAATFNGSEVVIDFNQPSEQVAA